MHIGPPPPPPLPPAPVPLAPLPPVDALEEVLALDVFELDEELCPPVDDDESLLDDDEHAAAASPSEAIDKRAAKRTENMSIS